MHLEFVVINLTMVVPFSRQVRQKGVLEGRIVVLVAPKPKNIYIVVPASVVVARGHRNLA